MLIPDGRFILPELPAIYIYPDDRLPHGFYAIPVSPRIATEDASHPAISLVIYGCQEGDQFKATGGLLTLTTTLELTPSEHQTLHQSLNRHIKKAISQSSGQQASAPQLLSPEWLKTEVEVYLTGKIKLMGQSSMFGVNQCSLSNKLSSTQALELMESWGDGLPQSKILYRIQLRAAPASSAKMEFHTTRSRIRNDETLQQDTSIHISTVANESKPYALELEGPIHLKKDILAQRMNTITI